MFSISLHKSAAVYLLYLIAFILIPAASWSCRNQYKEKVRFTFKRSLSTLVGFDAGQVVSNGQHPVDSTLVLYKSDQLFLYDFKHDSLLNKFNLSEVDTSWFLDVMHMPYYVIYSDYARTIIHDSRLNKIWIITADSIPHIDTEIDLNPVIDSLNIYLFNSLFQALTVFNDWLYLSCEIRNTNTSNYDDRILTYNHPTSIRINLKTGAVQAFIKKVPSIYVSRAFYGVDFFNFDVHDDHKILFSPKLTDEVFEYNLEDGSEQHFLFKANKPPKHIPLPPDSVFNTKYIINYQDNEEMYRQIIYDPFRKYYYRMVNYAYQKDSTGKINSFYKPFSIIIADSSFQKIGEFTAPVTYFPNNLLISKEGVILLNQEKIDGIFRVTFELYSLEKNK